MKKLIFILPLIGVIALLSMGAYTPPEAVGANQGDTSPTLTVGISSPVQIFSTELTAGRTITLATTGAKSGSTFRVVRTGLGAFTLNVGGVVTLPVLIPTWCDVTYNGSAWILTGYGLLTP